MRARGALALLALGLAATPALSQKKYGPGVTDKEIKIGTTTPFSGPASAYSAGAVSATAYFQKINDEGGVNGRKINYIALDDAYSPPKTVEQIRKLIESEEVLFLVNPVGTATNNAVVKYINQKQVPHLFIGTGATMFNDPETFPVDDELDAALRVRRRDLRQIYPSDRSPMRRSASSRRTTISGATIFSVSSAVSATRRRP